MPTVRLLGPVDVIDDEGVIHTPGSPLRCTLLALLALQRRSVVDTEALLDRIWDGRPPASGRRALRFHISRLRSEVAIADLIVTVGSAYRLDANTDLVSFSDGPRLVLRPPTRPARPARRASSRDVPRAVQQD